MTGESSDPASRRQELYIASLLFGLTAEEQAELDALDGASSDEDLLSLAEIIALLDRSRAEAEDVRLPESLREVIRRTAPNELPRPVEPRPEPARSRNRLPWAVAAACLLISLGTLVYFVLFRTTGRQDPVRQREQLLASTPDLIRVDWAAGPTPVPGAKGDIAWSNSEQRGFLRFQGMKVNDPSVEQYQLWIFDRNQDEKTPVDGGVFDIPSTGEVVVPIRPSLRVREPYLFAVTIEKPGGVVVSDRRRLPLLAAVSP
jgi:hypothetical protein